MPDLTKKTTIRKGVMIPCFAFMAFIIVLGIFKNDWLKTICKSAFRFSLINFGWAYQLVAMASLVCVAVVTFSKIGNLRIGGPNARPKYSFKTWFAMALTGGISVGIVNWGVNEPMVYFGNVYGELEQLGIAPQSAEAYRFALGRCFYNWTFVPYAFYGITGLLMAYLFFNKKSKFSVAATLKPVLGKHADKTGVAAVADTLCSIGIVLGMACGLGTGVSFIISGLKVVYGLETGIPTWVILGLATTAIFTGAAYLGIDKGVKKLASFNSKIFYGLLILLIIIGPTIEIFKALPIGLGEWLNNFFVWGLDPVDVGGEALTAWWTLFDWTSWINYAPVMALFLAKIAYGRTVREFMIINWILPSIFGMVWFSVWGGTALNWQMTGAVDLVSILIENGSTASVWGFLENLPFGLATILVPVVMVTLLLSFCTAADSVTHTLASLCATSDRSSDEAPNSLKLAWGLVIGSVSVIMGAFAGGVRGVDGVRQLSALGATVTFLVFVLQLASFMKTFFNKKIAREAEYDAGIDVVAESEKG